MANFEKFLEYKEKLTDESLQNDLKSFMENFLKQQGRKIIGKTMFRTPVDTGALRASWQLGDIEEKTKNDKLMNNLKILFINLYLTSNSAFNPFTTIL